MSRSSSLLDRYLAAGLGLLLYFLGTLLHPNARDVDTAYHFTDMLGSLCTFQFWALAVFCSGRWISRALGLISGPAPICLALGSLLWLALSILLGHLGLISYACAPIAVVLGFVSLFLGGNALFPSPLRFSPSKGIQNLKWFPVGIFSIWASVLFLSACLTQFHSDPLYDHMIGPRLWVEAGRIYFPPLNPFVFKNSYWQYLLIWGNLLLGGPSGLGLVETQLFGQWLHFFFGFLGSAFLLERILRRPLDSPIWRYTAVLAAISSQSMNWAAHLAKDDYGAVFWFLLGFWFLRERASLGRPNRARRWLVLAGIAFGAALAAKMTSAYTLLGLVIGMLLAGALDFRELFWLGVGTVFAASPLLLRNGFATGNPFFPFLNPIFQSEWVSPAQKTLLDAYAAHSTSRSWAKTFLDLRSIFSSNPAFWLMLIAVPGLLLLKFFRRAYWTYLGPFIALIPFLWMIGGSMVADGPGLLLRIFGPGFVLGSAFSIVLFREFLYFSLSEKWRNLQLVVCLILWVISARGFFFPHSWESFISTVEANTQALRAVQPGGFAKAWLRLNTHPDELVVSTGDNQTYYISQLRVVVLPDQPQLDRLALSLSTLDIYWMLFDLGARYVINVDHPTDQWWGPLAFRMDRIVFLHPESILFSSRDATIVSPQSIIEAVTQSCPLAARSRRLISSEMALGLSFPWLVSFSPEVPE